MTSSEGPDAWLGLLKWSLNYQDGTAPSDARPMGDEDRAWLEKVMREGVRDEVKTMTDIYSRLCAYLDRAATNPPPPLPRAPRQRTSDQASTESTVQEGNSANQAFAASGSSTTTSGSVSISAGTASDFVPPPPPTTSASTSARAVPASDPGGGVLSTFSVAAPSFASPSVAATEASAAGGAASDGMGGGGCTADELRTLEAGVLDDLEELQDIVEQIDMAATFAKIGGFGRLIALLAPARRPEKLRLRAASVIATLTRNNPPAQAAFSSSGGHRALIEVVATAAATTASTAPTNVTPSSDPVGVSHASPPSSLLSLPLQRAILHALSSSVMGIAPAEDALCLEQGFREFLAQALSQRVRAAGGDEAEAGSVGGALQEEESNKLRSKAAFVLKALISAPEASRARAEALWPAVLGLLAGLEALADGEGFDPAAARVTSIEALLAAARSPHGERVVNDLGSQVSRVSARRRQVLVEARETGRGSQEDADSADYELGLWLEWDALTGPAQ